MRRVLLTGASLGLVVCGALTAAAQQSATATLAGRITDPAGAVVAGAQITVEQPATGLRRETSTSGEGLYVFSSLPAGDYLVTVPAVSFPRTLRRAASSGRAGLGLSSSR